MQAKAKKTGYGLVYSYIRFSSAQQAAGTSLARQADYANKWALERGLALDESLKMRDEGRSAFKGHHLRGAFGAFMKLIEQGKVAPGAVLIVEAWDRLSRQTPMQAFRLLCEIIEAGVTVVTSSNGKEWNIDTLTKDEWALLEVIVDMSRAHKESKHKSERLQEAYEKKCIAWQEGKRIGSGIKGLIGGPNTDPNWLKYNYKRRCFEFNHDKNITNITRRVIELYLEGYGAIALVRKMRDEGYSFGGAFPTNRVTRLVTLRSLMGDKFIKANGKDYLLEGYYGDAALITREQFEELEHLVAKRTSRRMKNELPSLITGMQLVWCGYCQSIMLSQNQLIDKYRLDDGTWRPSARRLRCGLYYKEAKKCVGGESCSVAPIEHAIMTYCSDQMNLDRLLASNSAPDPRLAALDTVRAALRKSEVRLAEVQEQIESGDEGLSTLIKAAAKLEKAQLDQQAKLAVLEREVLVHQRAKPSTGDVWAALIDGVNRLDTDARVRARKLIADTFERIDVFMKGIHADERSVIRLRLTSKNGVVQELDIDRSTGERIDEDRFEIALIDGKEMPARKPRLRAAKSVVGA